MPLVAPIPTILTRDEIEQIKDRVKDHPVPDSEARRRALRQICQERVKHWKNTLSALRERKLQARQERLEQQERERQKIDEQEAEVQHAKRLEALKRANTQLNEQTDLMKSFRSAQLYSDVMAARSRQVKEKDKRLKIEKERDSAYHELILEQMNEYDKKETADEKERKGREKTVAKAQLEQLAVVRARRQARKEAEVEEGKEILARAMAEVEEDRRKNLARKEWHQHNNREMTLANERLQVLRKELALKDAEEDAKIEAVVKQKEATALARLQYQQDMFNKKQATRQRMIDRACAEMVRFTNQEETRMERQAQEQRDKQDADLARRAELRRRQQEAIEYSRVLQNKLREEKKLADQEANMLQAEVWAQRNLELEEEEREAAELKYRKNMEIKQFLEKQIKVAKKRKEDEKLYGQLGTAQGSALKREDRARFEIFALKEIEKAREAGKPLVPLLRVLSVRDEPLMAAKTNPVAKKEPQKSA